MSNRTAYKKLEDIEIESRPELSEIQVKLSYYWENDGIGPYEYWGASGYDHGHDYVVIEDYEYDKNNLTPEEIAIIDSQIENMLDTWSQEITDEEEVDMEPDYEPECEPDHFSEECH